MSMLPYIPFIFLCYIPLYAIALAYSAKNFRAYSASRYSMSTLGRRSATSAHLFNSATILFGLFTVALAFMLRDTLPQIHLARLFTIAQTVMGISMIGVAVLAVDIHKGLHDLLGGFLFISAFLLGLLPLFMQPFVDWFSSVFSMGSIALTAAVVAFSVSLVQSLTSKRWGTFTWKLEWICVFLIMLHSAALAAQLLLRPIG